MRLAFLSIGRHIHTERWIRWFAQRGHECHLLTVQPGPVEGVEVHDIAAGFGPKAVRYAVSLGKVKQLLGALRPDLLNTHFLTGYGYWGDFSGFHPNVLTVWGDDVYVTPHESAIKNWLARRALRHCDALTGDSADILECAVRLGADPRRAYRVLWGVDFDRFRPIDASQYRARLGFEPGDIVYFSPRSYTQPYYNIDVVIAAAARVKEQLPAARFLFAGYEGEPGPFRDRAEAAGIGDVMVFVGRIPHEEFHLALNAADVFLSVPSVDATAVSLLEAMACRSAIVVSGLASALEWISDGRSGLVVAPRDVEGLAAAMMRFGQNDALRRSAGEAALQTARRYAGFDANLQAVEGIYRSLVEGVRGLAGGVLPLAAGKRGESGTMILSVVIPTMNKVDLLRRTLSALLEQDAGIEERWEVVVVDDGSTDETADYLKQMVAAHATDRPALHVVAPGMNLGRARARNLGARNATGRWILFLDDDIVVPSGLPGAHLRLLRAHPGCGTIGYAVTAPEVRDAPHFPLSRHARGREAAGGPGAGPVFRHAERRRAAARIPFHRRLRRGILGLRVRGHGGRVPVGGEDRNPVPRARRAGTGPRAPPHPGPVLRQEARMRTAEPGANRRDPSRASARDAPGSGDRRTRAASRRRSPPFPGFRRLPAGPAPAPVDGSLAAPGRRFSSFS